MLYFTCWKTNDTTTRRLKHCSPIIYLAIVIGVARPLLITAYLGSDVGKALFGWMTKSTAHTTHFESYIELFDFALSCPW